MSFLFHTIIYFEEKPVYFNVFRSGPTSYFFEILENPHSIIVTNFTFDLTKKSASIELTKAALEQLAEQIDRYLGEN